MSSRPLLRMHDAARETLGARELRRVAFGVVVVAAAHEQEVAREAHRLALRPALRCHGPARVLRRPRSALHAMPEADALVDAVRLRGVLQVFENRRPVGDRLRVRPRTERVAERVHVRIGADAGIAEQVPRAADVGAAFQDRVGLARAALLQMTAGADAGNAGADDQDVDMFNGRFEGHGSQCQAEA